MQTLISLQLRTERGHRVTLQVVDDETAAVLLDGVEAHRLSLAEIAERLAEPPVVWAVVVEDTVAGYYSSREAAYDKAADLRSHGNMTRVIRMLRSLVSGL